ncbi:MAG: DUF1499 domain-containing protein [Elusimicrobiota bacterium]|nr:DUF1499 domain-containing protein [Elusimicrobiota bacterium]
MKKLLAVFALLAAACAPRINDITTTPDDPPSFRRAALLPENRGRDMTYAISNIGPQRKAYPDLKPLARADAPEAAYEAALAAARRMPRWSVLAADAAARVIEAVATTGALRFKDDVVIEVRPNGTGSAVHVRSKSRVGRSDFGANAERIRAYFAELGP